MLFPLTLSVLPGVFVPSSGVYEVGSLRDLLAFGVNYK